ncbi:MAG: adenylate/guanylate cyclase domain-containing protein [Syntrophales bacterium]|nr:adenylate/guanylate cyclase domain-containing protein [Syntrophales bacterium]
MFKNPIESQKMVDGNLISPEFCRIVEDDETRNALLIEYLNSFSRTQDDYLQKRLLKELIAGYVELEKRVDSLLKNTLPSPVVEEIKSFGHYSPRFFDCTILFSDLVGFTKLAERKTHEELINFLDILFQRIDAIVNMKGGNKIKTIGDAYMAVFGAPVPLSNHAERAIESAQEILRSLREINESLGEDVEMRIGIHSGRVIGGVVGKERMQFDVFGDDVNIAARFESAGIPSRINVSESTYLQSRGKFSFEPRGKIALKAKGKMAAYIVKEEPGVREEKL